MLRLQTVLRFRYSETAVVSNNSASSSTRANLVATMVMVACCLPLHISSLPSSLALYLKDGVLQGSFWRMPALYTTFIKFWRA